MGKIKSRFHLNRDFSERELTFTFASPSLYAIAASPVSLSAVCRLDCNVRANAPYSAGWNFWQSFFAVWYGYSASQLHWLMCLYLGVTVNCSLRWNQHIDQISAAANRILGFLRPYALCIDPLNTWRIVRPKLEYCSNVWDPHQQKYIDKLEMTQPDLWRTFPFDAANRLFPYLRWCLILDGNPCSLVGSTANWPWRTRSQMDWLKFHRSTILYHVRRTQQEVIPDNSRVSNLRLTHLSMRFFLGPYSSLECSSTSSCWGGLAWYIQATYEPTSAVLTICILQHVYSVHLFYCTFVLFRF